MFAARLRRRSKEAAANAEISKEKESTQTRSRLARFGAGEISRSQHPYIEEWTKNLRSRDRGIRRVILLGAAIGVQPDCCSALQDQSRTEMIRTVNDSIQL